ncbi:MAG: ABC transporter permease, partial [Bacillota bacterium]
LSLMGVSRAQLMGLIAIEGLLIGAAAVFSGLAAGLLFLKLFFMAVSAVLQLPQEIRLYAGPRVWGQTLLVFGAIFVLASLVSLRSVATKNPVQMIRARRQPKSFPAISRWRAALGLVLVLGGYAVACFPNRTVLALSMAPVTAMVSFGTYLLMREGWILLLSWLRRRERFFYRPGPFLSVSQLLYKVQENYQILAGVAVTVVFVLTAMGTIVTFYTLLLRDQLANNPIAIQMTLPAGSDLPAAAARVEAVLRKHGVTGLTYRELITRTATVGADGVTVTLIPFSLYAALDRPQAEALPALRPDEAILCYYFYPWFPTPRLSGPSAADLTVGGERIPLKIWHDHGGDLLNDQPTDYTLVLEDGTFAALMARTPAAERLPMAVWIGPGWQDRALRQALAELRSDYPDGGPVALSSKLEAYLGVTSFVGTLFFIGLFMSLLAFLASISEILFRLFTEIEDDRRYFQRLAQLGVSLRELKRLALGQVAVVFFVPFGVGVVHTTFAMKALSFIVSQPVLHHGWMAAAAYLAPYLVTFAGAAELYWRSLRAGLKARAAA